MHSLILPGWGQIIKGQKTKGKILASITGGNLIAVGTLFILQKKYHDNYLESTSPDDIKNKYDAYNRIYKARQICCYFTGAIWIYAVADALISQPKSSSKITFLPGFRSEVFSLNIALKF